MTDLHQLQHPTVVVVTLVAAACYVAYHYGANARRFAAHGPATAIHLQRLGGAVLLGVVPGLVAWALPGGWADYGVGLRNLSAAAVFIGCVVLVVLPVIALAARGPRFRDDYPQIRGVPWDARLRLHNLASWALYLCAYEFFFRGFLLFPLAAAFGAWPAIAVTTLAYAYAHLPKNAAETIGTLPIGVLFAAVALHTGGLWAPFLAHVLIANWSDWLATRE